MNALCSYSFDADEFAVCGEIIDFSYDISDHSENQESSSQEEEDEPEATYDDEEKKGTTRFLQDDFWLTTPNFIASTYEMISNSKPEVACWSDDGEMFIVKDQTVLSRMYIPKYFKHCNFSSFDRQLNLYGFRKKFSHILSQQSVSDTETDKCKESANYLRFHHRHFKRGRTDLLHLIKRENINKSSSEKKKSAKRKIVDEVQELKEELSSLESHLTSVVYDIEQKFAQLSKDIEGKFVEMQRIVSDTSNRLLRTQENFEVEKYLHSFVDVDLDGQTLSGELQPLNLNFQRSTSTSELPDDMNSEIVSLFLEMQPTFWQAGLDTSNMDREANVPDSCL